MITGELKNRIDGLSITLFTTLVTLVVLTVAVIALIKA